MIYHHNNIDAILDETGKVIMQNVNPQCGEIIAELLNAHEDIEKDTWWLRQEIKTLLKRSLPQL